MSSYNNNRSNGRDAKIVKRTKLKESKNGAEYNYAYVEIGGNLYKISVTEAQKEAKTDKDGHYWLGIKNCGRVQGGRGGNGGGYGGRGGYGNRY